MSNPLLASTSCGLDQSTSSQGQVQASYVCHSCLNRSRSVILPGNHRDQKVRFNLMLAGSDEATQAIGKSDSAEAFESTRNLYNQRICDNKNKKTIAIATIMVSGGGSEGKLRQ